MQKYFPLLSIFDAMTKYYQVALHRFALSMPSSSPLWMMASQYNPFEIPEAEDVIFSLEIVPEYMEVEKEPVYTEPPSEPGQTRIEIYKIASGWRFEAAPSARSRRCCVLDTTEDFSKATLWMEPERRTALFSLNNALMVLYAFRTAGMGTLEMHSSVVMRDGKAYMFLGKSGTGKSTHSRQWLETFPGTELLNDDNPILRVFPDGSVIVYGSPWSGKTPCYRNLSTPVGAIVRIRQCPENKAERMSVVQAYASLYSSCSGLKFHKEMADGLHASLEAAATRVPCFVLDCRPDHEAAEVCYQAVK